MSLVMLSAKLTQKELPYRPPACISKRHRTIQSTFSGNRCTSAPHCMTEARNAAIPDLCWHKVPIRVANRKPMQPKDWPSHYQNGVLLYIIYNLEQFLVAEFRSDLHSWIIRPPPRSFSKVLEFATDSLQGLALCPSTLLPI